MSINIVFGQMMIIFVLMMVGFIYYKIKEIPENITKFLSALVVNVCSPALLIHSVLGDPAAEKREDVLIFAGITILCFGALILLGKVIVRILRISGEEESTYQLMTIFSNVGFIGIPVASALFGSEALIYVAVYNLVFSITVFTYGVYLITKNQSGPKSKFPLREMVNPGTIACVITIMIFLTGIQIPEGVETLFSYIGTPATFLSLFVIGTSLAQMNPKDIISDKRLFYFTGIRYIIFPVLLVWIVKIFVNNSTMRGIVVLMVAMPVANLPAMIAKQYGVDETPITKGIVLTTLLSVITITGTCMLL